MKKNTIYRFLAIGLPLMFIFAPFFVSAQTVADLQAQITSLLQQVKALQMQLSQVQGTPNPVFCRTFNANFGIGSNSGSDTTALSEVLNRENLGVFVTANGMYDESMASAVSAFQEKYRSDILTPVGLRSGTGYVGAQTRAKLNALYGCSTTSPTQTSNITVVSPNGGEVWTKGTTQTIVWQDSFANTGSTPKSYDIKLVPYYPSCTGTLCPMFPYHLPYTIATNVMNTNYSWIVGNVQDSNSVVSDSPYTIQICQAGTNTCDSSNSYFSIVSNTGGVSGPLMITTNPSLLNAVVGTFYSTTLTATGGQEPYAWSITSGSLPPGMNLNRFSCLACSTAYANITGTPTTVGQYTFTVSVSSRPADNSSPVDSVVSKEFSLTVNSVTNPTAPVILSVSPSSGQIGTTVTIVGNGFTGTDNYIVANGLQFARVGSSNGGTSLSFTIPSSVGYYCTANTVCPMAYLLVSPGVYPFKVVNSNGTSNTMNFAIIGYTQGALQTQY